MDNSQKAIMVGVGLFITIIVIAAVMLITGMGQNIVNKGTSEVAGLSAQLENTLIQKYDNKTLTGAEVKAAVQQYWGSTEIGVVIRNTDNIVLGDYYFGGNKILAYTLGANKDTDYINLSRLENFNDPSATFKKDYTRIQLNEFNDTTKKSYIPNSNMYKARLAKLKKNIVGVVFEKI